MLLTAFCKKLCPDLETVSKSVRMMKIVALFLLAGCMQLSAKTAAQGLSLSLSNVPISTAFNEIQQQTAYRFVYTNEQLSATSKITLTVQNASIEKVLELCFKDQPLTWSIEDKFIIVKTKEKKMIDPTIIDNEIRGKITNDKNEPVAGATISMKGSKKATASDNRGEFVLADVVSGSIIVVSSIGFESQEIIIGNNRFLTIRLQNSVSALDEMVIKGYYTVSKRLNTGSVAKLSAEDIGKQPVANPLAAMEGRLTGVSIKQSTGTPGSGFSIQVRGQNSLRNNSYDNGNFPLYIVNGMPFTPTTLTSSSINYIIDGGNPLGYLNPADIESIEVLKDADATAIYGSRGANGIVLITTRKGKAGKTRVDVNLNAGFGKVSRKIPLLDTKQYLQMRHEALINDGVSTVPSSAYDINGQWDSTRYTDWQKVLIGGTAQITDMELSVSGGNEQTQFILASGYRRETTVFPGDFYDKKGSVYFNLNHATLNQKFKLSFSATYLNDNNHLLQNDLFGLALNLPPDAPALYDVNGKINWQNSTWNNPLAELQRKYNINTDNLISNLTVNYQLPAGFLFKTNLGYTKLTNTEISTTPISTWRPSYGVTDASASFGNGYTKSWVIEPELDYALNMKNYKWSVLIGTTFQENIRQLQTNLGIGFTNDALLENITAAPRIVNMDNVYVQYRYNALYARINGNWKDKLVVNLTARRDGSSRFGNNRQFANFGSAGMAWIFSKSKFSQNNLAFMSFGKLRASYGITGNDLIGDYGYLDTYSPTTYAYQGVAGLYPTGLENTDYGWETNKKMELGAEFGFIKDRLLLNIVYYRNRSSNQLVGYALPPTTGFTSIQKNLPATVQNTGWELELTTFNLKQVNFSWKTALNISVPRNKLVSYPNIEGSGYNHIYAVGKPLGINYGVHSTGVDPATGVYSFQDVDNNGTISVPNDQLPLKAIVQDYYGGLQNSFAYRNFTLDLFFQFIKQTGRGYLAGGIFLPAGMLGNQPALILNRWQKPGDLTNVQRFTQDYGSAAYKGYSNSVYSGGDNVIEDASFIRLKNIQFAYTLPLSVTQKMSIESARFYIQGQNLLLWTKFSGNDPENYGAGRIPPLRVLSAGIQLTF